MSFMENTTQEKNIINIQSIQLKQLIITILFNIYIKYPLPFMKNSRGNRHVAPAING